MNNGKTQIFYQRLGRPIGDFNLERRRQDVLHDTKWKVFLKRRERFRFIPFVDFAFAAGSMALGNVHKSSDFDVIVGCRYGRIFTARFFAALAFGLFNQRRKKLSHHEEANNKICLNHFITEKSLRLAPPHNLYWQELYKNLVPLYGDAEKVKAFWAANDWLGKERIYIGDRRHGQSRSFVKIAAEKILSGVFGDLVESFLRSIQLRRIENNLKNEPLGFEPRLRYDDSELEFHPDTERIRNLVFDL